MRLDHINIRATSLPDTVTFLEQVAELKVGDRPPFTFDGKWMYDDTDSPVVHLRQAEQPSDAVGPVDHFAFRGEGLDATRQRLRNFGYEFVERVTPGRGTVQLFVKGPDDITVELQFPPRT